LSERLKGLEAPGTSRSDEKKGESED
jgi:hypothetical protein